MDSSVHCQDCGAPAPPGREDCPFCAYPMLFHRASQGQRGWLVWLFLGLRLLVLLTVLLGVSFVMHLPSLYHGCNIGG